jgi:D-tyrosyl-tRNA(Tyr) deacylase
LRASLDGNTLARGCFISFINIVKEKQTTGILFSIPLITHHLLSCFMIVVIQRTLGASVEIEKKIKARIDNGLMILLGIEDADGIEDIQWLANKIANLRIFNDTENVMNVSLKENGGDIIVVSQFTLHASTKKGNRPSYIKAAKPEIAIPIYQQFITELEMVVGKPIQTGEFGADMKVQLINDGPVTIVIDTKNKI